MTKENQYKIEEWKILREEIARKQSLNYNIIFSTIGLNFAIYSFALGTQSTTMLSALLVMLPVVVVGLSQFWILRNDFSSYRIALYIKNCIENPEEHEFAWETSLYEFTKEMRHKKSHSKGFGKKNLRETHFIFYLFYFISPLLSSIILFYAKVSVSVSSPLVATAFNATIPAVMSLFFYLFFHFTLLHAVKEDIRILTETSFPRGYTLSHPQTHC